MSGNIYARRRIDSSRQLNTMTSLATIERFNLNSFDAADILHISPPENLVSIRSQEEEMFHPGSGQYGFAINRFDFFMDNATLMRLFMESRG